MECTSCEHGLRRHWLCVWLFEAEINLKSEMDLRLPNFREIFVFHSEHKTFPLWRWTTNDAAPWRSRTGTPLRAHHIRWMRCACAKKGNQFEKRGDSVRKQRADSETPHGNEFRFVWFWKCECARVMETNFEWLQAMRTEYGHSGTRNQSQINWFQKRRIIFTMQLIFFGRIWSLSLHAARCARSFVPISLRRSHPLHPVCN